MPEAAPKPITLRAQNGRFLPGTITPKAKSVLPPINPNADNATNFLQLSGDDCVAHLRKILSYPLPASLELSLLREEVLGKIQARVFQVYSLDRDTTVNVTVQTMSSIADSYDPKRITECITDVQVVDVQQVASDAQSEADGSGI